MTDPLSIAGSVAGVVSLGIQVTQSLVDFYTSYKHQDAELASIIDRLESLRETFESLQKSLSGRIFSADERGLIKSIETSMNNCDELVQELQHEAQSFEKSSSNGMKAAIKVAGRRITYPFRQSTLQKIDEDIKGILENLSIALDVLQLNNTKMLHDDVAQIKTLLELVKSNQITSAIRDWLRAPDATIDHNVACAKKHPGTGTWLVKSPEFSTWLTKESSLVWLKGFAGSGKSVLCSTAIQAALRDRGSDRSIGIAFFYFTFNDNSKQDESSMLRALLLQLSSQLQNGEADLMQLQRSYSSSVPPSHVLLEYLRHLIQKFRHTYIFLDALDESPPNGPREKVLDIVESLQNGALPNMHLFITSRDYPDVRECLSVTATQEIAMRNTGIDDDIIKYISGRLSEDRKLRRLLAYHDKIQVALAKGAKGVFRWVECQLRALQSCPRSEDHLDKMLGSLPQSLDETYERILCTIDTHLVADARRILTLCCFAARPLTVPELIDGIAVEIEDIGGLNRKRRLQDADDIRDICLGLIDVGFDAGQINEVDEEVYWGEIESWPTVRIAHFSIQEYLTSERIRSQKAAIFSLNDGQANAEIAQICLTYLLDYDLSHSRLDGDLLSGFPLAYFAAQNWHQHHRDSAKPAPLLDDLVLRLFQDQYSFVTWLNLHKASVVHSRLSGSEESFFPIYFASLLGLKHTLSAILVSKQGENLAECSLSAGRTSIISYDFNLQVRVHFNALLAASAEGHKEIVQMLLEKGAKINSQGVFYGDAASIADHFATLQLLFEQGANVNARSENFSWSTALTAASYYGHDKIVQLLLEKGANINAQGSKGTALEEASFKGHYRIVQLLLEKGADINAQSKTGTALIAASSKGYYEIVQLLLRNGADVNVQSENSFWNTALIAASYHGYDEIAQLLLEKGANINVQSKTGTALIGASSTGYYRIVQLLLRNGADVNVQSENRLWNTALIAASDHGHDEIVQLLLDKGADINIQGGKYGNALRVASLWAHTGVMQILLDHGADTTFKDTHGRSLLHLACSRRSEWASDNTRAVQILLDHGAKPDLHDTQGRYPIHLACEKNKIELIELLYCLTPTNTLVDLQGRNCLHHAALGGSTEVAQWLLNKGFDPNEADRDGWTPLHWAAKCGEPDTIAALKDAGATSAVEDIKGWTPESVAMFHDNSYASMSDIDAPDVHASSELSSLTSLDPSAQSAASNDNEQTIGKGTCDLFSRCDGCLLGMYGPCYKCSDCPDFSFCFKCNHSSHESHAGHTFFVTDEDDSEEDKLDISG